MRKSIIEFLSNRDLIEGNVEALLATLDCEEKADLEVWLSAAIRSITQYKPNEFLLVLNGGQAVGKTEFMRRLLWDNSLYKEDYNLSTKDIYENLIVNYDEAPMFRSEYKEICELPLRHDFRAVGIEGDKRLASYSVTTNSWNYNRRKNVLVLNVKSIDWHSLNAISKADLWTELFNKYK